MEAAIALGGNVGDVESTFRRALLRLDKKAGITLLRRSDWIVTAAEGGPGDQPDFLNGAILVETTLSPEDLLEACLEIETHFGRERTQEARWGPRTLDMDVLLYGDQTVSRESLTIPHARRTERRFVLQPLSQIAPSKTIPGVGSTVEQCLERLVQECGS
ncbi:MAG: 2-amino-4-hydroxy-6-hydroxymethyldihydropteridine diphosphokinase [Sulfitobacter sp.]|nr:2-amino-4-hydroxy-6-hydroxymethyldihydropteridine diphosphokinase [Sulfitobacter sp.]